MAKPEKAPWGVAPLAKGTPLAAGRALPCFLGMALMVCSSMEQNTSKRLQSSYTIAWRQDWSVLKASGSAIREYLQGQITQDMNKLTPVQGIHAFILTPQGKAVSELYLVEENNDEFILLTPADYAVATVARLRQFSLGYKLRIGVVDKYRVLEIQGAHAAEKLQHFDFQNTDNEWLTTRHTDHQHALMMSENPHTFWIIGNASNLETMVDSDILDQDYTEAIRIIRGIPRFGVDWDEKIYPMNANLIEFNGVDFDKGCYVGQEVTSRMHWRNGTKKRFYRVQIEGKPETLPCPIFTTAKIGMLTSAATDSATNTCFGIAHLPVNSNESDAPLSLTDGTIINIIGVCHP